MSKKNRSTATPAKANKATARMTSTAPDTIPAPPPSGIRTAEAIRRIDPADPLGIRADATVDTLHELTLPQLLASATIDGHRDIVIDMLDEVIDHLDVVAPNLRDPDAAVSTDDIAMLLCRATWRLRVAAELHRRMMEALRAEIAT